MKQLLLLLISLLATSLVFAQPVNVIGSEDEDDTPKRGKCYARVQYPAKTKIVKKTYILYTGRDLENPHVKEQDITLEPEYLYWKKNSKGKYQVYKKRRSYETLYIVTDTIAERKFKTESIEQVQVVQKGYKSDKYHRHVCPDEVDEDLLTRLSQALTLEGYQVGGGTPDTFGGKLETALIEYQLKEGLPPGTLNIRTLAALGVESLEDWSIYDDEEEE